MPEQNKKYKYERVYFTFNNKQYEATGKTKKEAHAKAAKKRLDLELALETTGGNMSVKQWAYEWLETYKAPAIGEGQYKNYLYHIDSVIIPAIGNKKIKDIRDIDLQKILNSRAGKSKSDLSKLRNTLKAMFKQARMSRLIPYDPAESIIMPAASDGTHRSLTPDEREVILKLAETHHAGLWIKTMLYCGLRPGECRALDWRHIDFENKLIYIKQAMKTRTKLIGAPKSNAGIRNVPIPDKLLDEFRAVRREDFEPVFTQPTTGRRHTETSMRSMWENFKRRLDISLGAKLFRNKIIESKVAPDLMPYCLRHTFATDLQRAGVPINIAKYLLGHANISLTADIYTHMTDAQINEIAHIINNFQSKDETFTDANLDSRILEFNT